MTALARPTSGALRIQEQADLDAGALCGEKCPERPSIRCTREPHKGGHLNHRAGHYWQAAEETAEARS